MARMRLRSEAEIWGLLLNARETVDWATFALRATSRVVMGREESESVLTHQYAYQKSRFRQVRSAH